MKKYVCLLCAVCIIVMGIPHICAAQDFDFTWNGNYTDMTLDITVTTPSKYTQTVSVVVYPDGLENPTPLNVTRMAEAQLVGGKTTVVSVPVDNDMKTSDGKYTVVVQGSGYQYESSRKTDSNVYILTPSDINGSGGLLAEFNNATVQTLSSSFAKVQKPLKLGECDVADTTLRYNAFVNIRSNDYNGKFNTLDDVKKAWECSQIEVELGKNGVTSDMLKAVYEKCADFLGVDVSGDEYLSVKTELYNKMLLISKNHNVRSIEDATALFEKSYAVALINSSDITTVESAVVKYASALGISKDVMNKYNSIPSQSSKDIVLIQLLDKSFDYPSQIQTEFTDAVNAVTDSSNLQGGSNQGFGGSQGGSSAGFGGGASSGIGSVDIGHRADSDDFKDVGGSHWAYLYVNELRNRNVINGYNDGTFKPDNLVTREEFVKMIVTAYGLYNKDANCSFDDVANNFWARDYIASAVERGIITGISDKMFGTGRNITRQDATVIAYRVLNNISGYSEESDINLGFADADKVSDYAKESVASLSGLNIINGFSDGTFRPEENLTRAQAAKIIALLLEQI